MQNKLVSIAMATYNGEKFLCEQLDSIYNQTYKNIEVVVCDDCSTDKTAEILEKYRQKYGLKYYINEKNLGYVKNFEKATSLCSGEFIAFSDQDDIWLPEKIEMLVNEIGDYSLVHTDSELINSNSLSLDDTRNKRLFRENDSEPAINFGSINKKVSIQGCTCLFKREILKKVFPFKKNKAHDVWVGIIALKMNGIKYIDESLVKYRLHGNNVCGINPECEYLKCIKFFKKNFPFLYSKARYLYRLVNHLDIQFELKQRGL